MGGLMAEEMGCQLMGAVGRLLEYKPLYNAEVDALQRRLFAFPEYMEAHDITQEGIRTIRTEESSIYFMGYLRTLINEYSGDELTDMFF